MKFVTVRKGLLLIESDSQISLDMVTFFHYTLKVNENCYHKAIVLEGIM